MKVEIDPYTGFCFGVRNALHVAEEELKKSDSLFCLGEIVHNEKEVERLHEKGLEVIDHQTFRQLKNTKVLIRTHGEPPETYRIAFENNIQLIDATCPVVLKLQKRIRESFSEIAEKEGQLVIYGKKGHAEVEGLKGQIPSNAIVIGNDLKDLEKIDFTKPIMLFCQTTQDVKGFQELVNEIHHRINQKGCGGKHNFTAHDTICRQVSNREPRLKKFAGKKDVVVFVSGKNSSNGRYLFQVCKQVNPRSYFVTHADEVDASWFNAGNHVGICGATSTPGWLMESVAKKIQGFTN